MSLADVEVDVGGAGVDVKEPVHVIRRDEVCHVGPRFGLLVAAVSSVRGIGRQLVIPSPLHVGCNNVYAGPRTKFNRKIYASVYT